ncbi:cohesin domain-containing protein [Dehalococcoidia bacterium]|nr:cohesin domain-containing protein [Dehalococcoidia bacterium]
MSKKSAKWRVGWSLVAVLALLLSLPGSLVLPEKVAASLEAATVFLDPPSQPVEVGGKTTVEIRVTNVDNLYGAEVHLDFDPALLKVVDADAVMDGVQIAPSTDFFPFAPEQYYEVPENGKKYYYAYSEATGGYFIPQAEANNAAGTISYAFTLLDPAPAVSVGPEGKTLATITFERIGEGTTNIDFVNPLADEPPVKLADVAGSPIHISPGNIHGAVILQKGVPAITLTPTSGPVGTLITVTGTGFAPHVGVDIKFDGDVVGSAITNADGDFSADFTVPDKAPGDYTVTAIDGAGNKASATFSLEMMVNISIQPPTRSVVVGETFIFDIQADAGDQPVHGVSAFLDFDPTYLEVVSITPGDTLDVVLLNTYDNDAGTIDYSAGTLTEPFPSGTFIVATVEFKAIEETAATAIDFSTSEPRRTMAVYEGQDVTGVITGGTVEIRHDAPIFLQPPAITVYVGQTFELEIKTNVDDPQPVSGVAAFINFDAAKLEVVSVTPGPYLPLVLLNEFDNDAGTIDYSGGQALGEPPPTGTFLVATIEFKALAEAPSTSVTFNFTDPRKTMVVSEGIAIPGTHANATVEISPKVPVDISMVLQGGARPDEGWEIPVTINFFQPGADVLADTPVKSLTVTTVKVEDRAVAQVRIAPGTYDVTVASETTLINVRRNVDIPPPVVLIVDPPTPVVDMGTLLEGNANGDHVINIADFSILAGSFGKAEGDEAFDRRADFDRNGIVNIADFSLLAGNFMKTSPVEIPSS